MGCAICEGTGFNEYLEKQCVFCNGTGDENKAAEGYMSRHSCQCVLSDGRWCPACRKKCHHSTRFGPTILMQNK